MNVAQLILAVIGALATVAGICSSMIGLLIRLEVSQLRTFIETARREDSDAIRKWAEEHFERRGAA